MVVRKNIYKYFKVERKHSLAAFVTGLVNEMFTNFMASRNFFWLRLLFKFSKFLRIIDVFTTLAMRSKTNKKSNWKNVLNSE